MLESARVVSLGLGGLGVQDVRASTSRFIFVVGRIPLVLFLICQGGAFNLGFASSVCWSGLGGRCGTF